ncbi:MAG: MarR family transcriptional regulator [Candidatus Thiodiazotropha sp.]
MKLSPITESFVLHWGEMGTRWGVNRTVAQIHALLYLSEQALTAEEITEILGVARSNVSNSIKELLSWRLVKVVHIMGDRRDHFETSKEVWELFKLIVAGRKQREIDPTLAVLDELLASPDLKKESSNTRKRIEETQQFIYILTQWSDEMLRLEPETLMKVLKLGAKIRNLIRRDNGK